MNAHAQTSRQGDAELTQRGGRLLQEKTQDSFRMAGGCPRVDDFYHIQDRDFELLAETPHLPSDKSHLGGSTWAGRPIRYRRFVTQQLGSIPLCCVPVHARHQPPASRMRRRSQIGNCGISTRRPYVASTQSVSIGGELAQISQHGASEQVLALVARLLEEAVIRDTDISTRRRTIARQPYKGMSPSRNHACLTRLAVH